MGLLFVSPVVGCGLSVTGFVVAATGLPVPVVDDVVLEVFDGFFAVDHELQVSQPSADLVDRRQQDQRLPLHRPAWYRPLRPGFSLQTGTMFCFLMLSFLEKYLREYSGEVGKTNEN